MNNLCTRHYSRAQRVARSPFTRDFKVGDFKVRDFKVRDFKVRDFKVSDFRFWTRRYAWGSNPKIPHFAIGFLEIPRLHLQCNPCNPVLEGKFVR